MSKRIFCIVLIVHSLFSFQSFAGPFFPQDTILACGRTYTLTAGAGLSNYLWNTGATTQSITTNRTGWYFVSALQNGVRISDSVYLNLLYVNIINNDSSICPGNSVVLNAETAFNFSCTGYPAQQYTSWTSIGPLGVIYKWNNTYYIRTLTDVLQSSNLNGPWTSMGFFTQTGVIGPAELLGVDATGRLHVGTTNNGVYVYSGGVWTSNGLSGNGTAGQFFTLLSNGRIVISRSGSAAGIYYSDDNGNTWIQANAPAITWFYFTVANNGSIFAVGSAGVIRSTDNGTTWTSINNQLGGATSATGISKDCNGTLWVVADRTLYSSSDNGNTWIPSLQIPGFFTSNPTAGTLLAASNGEIYYYGFISPLTQALYVTRDGGMSWNLVTGFPGLLSYLKEIDGQLIACTNQGVYALTLQPQITLQWSTGATTSSITVSPNQSTTYYVTASNGVTTCRDSVKINVGAVYSGLFTQDTIYHCGSAVNVSAPTGYSSYQWNTGAATRTISVTAPGIYYVQAQPASGCPVFDSVFVNILDIKILNNDTSICSGDSVELSVDPGQGLKTFCFDPPVVKGGNMATGYHSVAVDASGNYFLSGSFYGVTTIGGFPVSSAGGQDIFVVKYDSCGNPLWVIKGGSASSGDDAGSLDTDASGNVYFTGRYNQPLTLTGSLGSSFTAAYTPSGNGNHQDGFVVKISPSGQILWGATIQGGSNDGFSNVTVDHNNCAIVTGGFNGCCPSTFAATVNGPNGSVTVNSYGANYGTGVMVKFDAAGNILWKATIHNRDVGMDRTAVDASNNIYVVGTFRSWGMGTPADFIDGAGTTNTLYNPGIGLSYLVKLNANGIWQWGVTMGNQGDGVGSLTAATDVKTDAAGNPWVCGLYSGAAITFYSTGGGTISQPASSTNQGYLVKYSAAGVPQFSRVQQQSGGSTVFTGICVTASAVAVTGYYSGTNQGGNDGLLLMYDLSGQVLQSAVPGGTGDDYFSSIDWNGRNFVVGGATGSPLVNIDGVNLNGSCDFLWNATSFGTGSNTILWSTGDTTTSITVQPTQTTKYYVTVSNGFHSCRDSVTVTVNNLSNNLFAQDTIGICGTSYSLSAPQGYSSYQWNTGENTQSINAGTTGWYSCTVMQGNCPVRDSVFLSIVNANIVNNDTTICSGDSVTLSTFSNSLPRPCGQINSELQAGLVAYYPFCGNANDVIGSNHGVIYNATLSADRNSQPGRSFLFNGVNSSIIPATTNKTMINTFTYAFWARPNITIIVPNESQSGNAASGLFSNPCVIHPIHGVTFGNTNLSAGSGIYVGTNGLYIEEHSDVWEAVPLSYSTSLIGWHHYLVVYNNKIPSLYIDGNYIKSGIPSSRNIYASLGKDEYPAYTRSGFGAGYSPPFSSTSQYFSGEIDDIIYYNRALTPNDIRNLYFLGHSIIWSTGDTSETIKVSPTQTTTYYCTVSNGISTCIDSVKVTVNTANVQLFSQDTIAVCGTSYTLQAAPGYSSYQWNTGENSPSINAGTTGWYSCKVMQGNCPARDSVFLSIVNANIINNDTTICSGDSVTLSTFSNSLPRPCGQLPPGLQNGLVGYWPFCGNANDMSGNGNHGITIGANLTADRYGNLNQAFEFDGISDFIEINDNAPLRLINTDFTINTWVLPYDNNGNHIWYKGESAGNNYPKYIFRWNNNDYAFHINAPGLNTGVWAYSGSQAPSSWQMGTVIKQGNSIYFYVNSILSNVSIWTTPVPNTSGFNPRIGGAEPNGAGWWHGKLDDIALWNRPLTASEISSLFDSSSQIIKYLWSTGDTTPAIKVNPTQTTTYYSTVTNGISSCTDSVTVTVNQPSNSLTTLSSCDSFSWNGTTYTQSGNYTESGFTNAAGCDSLAILSLTINASTHSIITQAACDTFRWNNSLYNQSGTYFYNYVNTSGCPSTDTLKLAITPTNTVVHLNDTVFCAGSSVTITAQTTPPGNYDYSWTVPAGVSNPGNQESITTATPGLYSVFATPRSNLLCNSDFEDNQLVGPGGIVITNQANVPCWQTTAADQQIEIWGSGLNGTPSYSGIQFIELNANMFSTLYQNFSALAGTSVTVSFAHRGRLGVDVMGVEIGPTGGPYVSLGSFADGNTAWGYYTISFILPNSPSGNYSLRFVSISAAGGNITFGNLLDAITVTMATCPSLPDSCVVSVNQPSSSVTTLSTCDSLRWNGTLYTSSGDYSFLTINSKGCDSTAMLNLTVRNSNTSFSNIEECYSFTWNGQTYTQSGSYTKTGLTNTAGCDSTAILNLIIKDSSSSTSNTSACDSYYWNGQTYTQSGMYTTAGLSNAAGCDSSAILNLTINRGDFSDTSIAACISYDWNGSTYTQTGTYSYVYQNAFGCTSTDTLHLAVSNGIPTALTTATCDSYSWNGTTYTQSGDYSYTIMTGACVVTDTLHLTVHNGSFSALYDEACNSYDWNGATYTQSGTYTYNYPNSYGCASTDTLHLTINRSSHNAITRTACESYDWNASIYTQSGTYTHDYSNGFGCPSTDTLHLTVNYGTFNSVSQSACRNYNWNNTNYNSSGTYWTNYVNTAGCPSADSLKLTIFPGPSLGPDQNISICSGVTADLTALFSSQLYNTIWTFNQSVIPSPQAVSQPGNYYLIATDNNGCKDSVMVSLSVQPLPTANAGPDRYEQTNTPFSLYGTGGNSCIWSPAAVLDDAGSCNPQATLSANTLFVLTVYDALGCLDTDTVFIKVLDGPALYVPNAFTPNGDGLNDEFGPVTVGITELEYFRIYNRYGELVFETSVPANKWNGYYKGKPQDKGNFVWLAAARDRSGNLIFKKGNVLLIR